MLVKTAIITIIPAIAARAARAASSVCTPVAPGGIGGDTVPPPDLLPGGGIVVPVGTPILLEDSIGAGRYNTYTGVAPAPAGFVCRYQTTIVTNLNSPIKEATIYNIVCTRG